MSITGRGASRSPFAPPAAGSWAVKLGDSNSDDTIPYGKWYEDVCAYFGYKPLNSNLGANGSAEVDLTDWYGEFLPTGASITREGRVGWIYDGAYSVKFTGPTSPGTFYGNFFGAAPALFSLTQSGGVLTGATVVQAGGGYIYHALTVTSATGSGAVLGMSTHVAGEVSSVKATGGSSGTGYVLGGNTFSISDVSGNGSGARITPTFVSGSISGWTINAAGVAYRVGDEIALSNGASVSSATAHVSTINGTGGITGITTDTTGAGTMTAGSDCTISQNGCCIFITAVAAGAITALSNNFGAPYVLYASPTVAISGTGAGTIVQPLINPSGAVMGALIAAAGTGHTGSPTGVVATGRPNTRAYQSIGLIGGQTYALVVRLLLQTAASPPYNNIYVAANSYSNVGIETTMVALYPVNALDTYQTLFGVFTVPSNSIGTYFRAVGTSTAAGQAFWLDAAQIIKVPSGVTMTAPPTFTDLPKRGGIGGATIADALGIGNNPQVYTTPPVVNGIATTGTGIIYGGISSFQSTVAARVTAHPAANIVFIQGGINDVLYASTSSGANATTLPRISTALDAIFAAIAAMSPRPKVVVVGIAQFNVLLWGEAGAQPPAGYASYHDFAAAVNQLLEGKSKANGALFVPIRDRMNMDAHVLSGGPHWTNAGHDIVSRAVISAMEG